jgi:hypothetical protein
MMAVRVPGPRKGSGHGCRTVVPVRQKIMHLIRRMREIWWAADRWYGSPLPPTTSKRCQL